MSNNPNPNVKTVGLIIGSFKPYTKGHHFLVEKALAENDLVLVSVSQKNRIRKGEHPITWEKMKHVWQHYIIPTLPKNIKIVSIDNPIIGLFNLLKNQDNDEDKNIIFTLYMDVKDQKRYCYQEHQIKEKFPQLVLNNQIKIVAINRESNINVSGTKMRKTLQEKNLKGFKECLPEILLDKTEELFTLLS